MPTRLVKFYRRLPLWLFCLFLAACNLPAVQFLTPIPAAGPGLTAVTSTPLPPATLQPLPTGASLPVAILPTAALLASATPTPLYNTAGPEHQIIGYSVQGRPLEITRLGNGPHPYVIIGAIHGGVECATGTLVAAMLAHFEAEGVDPAVTLYVLPIANPDGCALNSRRNAHNVDLNRNWQTANWTSNAEGPGGLVVGSGGPTPFSEPETAALRDWLLALRQQSPNEPIRLIAYHSAVPETGLVQPGSGEGGEPSRAVEAMARTYARAALYLYSAEWVGGYTITGELAQWASDNGFVVMDVELPDHGPPDTIPAGWRDSHLETNLRALQTVMSDA